MEALFARLAGAAAAALLSAAPPSAAAPPADLALAAALWAATVAGALWLLGELVLRLGGLCAARGAAPLREVGKPLAALTARDEAFIAVNKLATAAFSFHLVRYCCLGVLGGAGASGGAGAGAGAAAAPAAFGFSSPAALRLAEAPVSAAEAARLLAALGLGAGGAGAASAAAAAAAAAAALLSALYCAASLALLFVLYDCLYAPFHLVLHHRSVYALVHKHHHRSAAPHRGNADAINVHPLEFALGEYNHLLVTHAAGWLLPALGLPPLHAGCVAVFVLGGGVLGSLNHTRFDIRVPGLFRVAWHDIHHHAFAMNYGQYTMAVDWAMGTFRDVAAEDEGGLQKPAAAAAAKEAPAGADDGATRRRRAAL